MEVIALAKCRRTMPSRKHRQSRHFSSRSGKHYQITSEENPIMTHTLTNLKHTCHLHFYPELIAVGGAFRGRLGVPSFRERASIHTCYSPAEWDSGDGSQLIPTAEKPLHCRSSEQPFFRAADWRRSCSGPRFCAAVAVQPALG